MTQKKQVDKYRISCYYKTDFPYGTLHEDGYLVYNVVSYTEFPSRSKALTAIRKTVKKYTYMNKNYFYIEACE